MVAAFAKDPARGIEWDHPLRQDIHTRLPVNNAKLRGWCAITSALLQRKLKESGIKSTMVIGHFHNTGLHDGYSSALGLDNHAWLVVGDKIVDATANQFSKSLPQVLIIPYNDARYKPRRTGKDAFRELRKTWLAEESPHNDGTLDKLGQIIFHSQVPEDWKLKVPTVRQYMKGKGK